MKHLCFDQINWLFPSSFSHTTSYGKKYNNKVIIIIVYFQFVSKCGFLLLTWINLGDISMLLSVV